MGHPLGADKDTHHADRDIHLCGYGTDRRVPARDTHRTEPEHASGRPLAETDHPEADHAAKLAVLLPHATAMQASLLAIDIDGTLVEQGDRISPATRDAVRRAHARGLPLVLATGRRYRTTRLVIDQLGLPLPAVCLGGALIKDNASETLHCEPFATAQVERLLALARQLGLTLILQRDAHARGGADFIIDAKQPWNPYTRHYARIGGDAGSPDTAPEKTGYDDVLVVGCFGDQAPLADLQDAVRTSGDEFASVLVESKKTPGWYLEIILGHVSKWTALKRFAEIAGVAPDAICAVGDALNDLPMIRGAAFGVAMGDAHPQVKAAADWVTGGHREDGLVALIERLGQPSPATA